MLPDRKIEEIRREFGNIGQKPLTLMIDYLNWDKYLLTQAILKTINKENSDQVLIYLDGALSRIDGMLHTLGVHVKKKNESTSNW